MTEHGKVKILMKLHVSAYLNCISLGGTGRCFVTESREGQPIGHEYDVDFSVEVPQKLMDMFNAQTFLAIDVKGVKDFLTDDADERTIEVAWRR